MSPTQTTPQPDESSASIATNLQLYSHQLRAHYSTRRVTVLCGGTGAGKTYYAPLWIWDKLVDKKTQRIKQGCRGLAVGRGYQIHVDRVMVYELRRFFRDVGVDAHYNEGKKVWTLPNDAEILMGSAEEPSSLEGPHVAGFAWMDEAGLMDALAWDVVWRRTGHWQAPILITTIPYVVNWLKSRVYDPWLAGDELIDWIHCRTADNLDYSREVIEYARRTWRKEKFETHYEGKFARPYGLIWPDPLDADLVVEPFDVPADWPAFAGHDWGVNDPTTGLWARLSPDGVLFLVAEYEVTGMHVEQHLHVWKELGIDGVDAAFGDPEGKDLMLRLSDLDYPVLPANNDVIFGIDKVTEWLRSGRLKVFRGLEAFVNHRNTYVWTQDRKDEDRLLDKPKDPQPARHLMDACRYLVVGVDAYGLGAVPSELSLLSTQVGGNYRPTPEQISRLAQRTA